MPISARCDYVCRALLELALHWPNPRPLRISTISRKQKIPVKYLAQILFQLKRIGFIDSVRGKQGGYKLARPPHKITMAQVLREMGGPFLLQDKSIIFRNSVFAGIWRDVEQSITKVLDKITFEDILKKVNLSDRAIVYQI